MVLRSGKLVISCLGLVLAASSFAVAPDNGADATFSFVGQMNGASAVAIGQRTVLTAGHVGAGTFFLGGNSYTVLSSATDPLADLTVVNLTSDLPGFYDLASSFTLGDTITMVGFGGTGKVANAGEQFYTLIGGAGTRRTAANTIDDEQVFTNEGPSLLSLLKVNGDAAVVAGDSGGGWFDNGKLVGINLFFDNETTLPNYGFASLNGGTPYFKSGALDLTNAEVRAFINANAVPEPASMLALVTGLALLIRRRNFTI